MLTRLIHVGGVIGGGDKTPLNVIGPILRLWRARAAGRGGRWHTINEMGRTDFPLLFGGKKEFLVPAADLAAGHSAPARRTDDHLAAEPAQRNP